MGNIFADGKGLYIFTFISITGFERRFIAWNKFSQVNLKGIFLFFFNCYLAVPRPTLSHSQGNSLTNLMLITVFVQVRPEGHWEPRNEVGSLSPAERLAGFEPGTFRFLFQCLNPLGHSPGMVGQQKNFSLISNQCHCQISQSYGIWVYGFMVYGCLSYFQ